MSELERSRCISPRQVMEVALRLAETLFSVIPLVELVERHQPEVLQALNSNRISLVCFVLNRVRWLNSTVTGFSWLMG